MNCHTVRDLLHELLDGELTQTEANAVEAHLATCASCLAARQDFEVVRRLLSARCQMPAPLQRRVWSRLQREKNRRWPDRIFLFWRDLRSWARDLDRTLVWSRLSAVPATLLGLMVLISLFPHSRVEHWDYAVFAAQAGASQGQPDSLLVQVNQPSIQFNGLMDTAWKIPYEDSLWLVADIQPNGNAEIGNVIEYPKNSELLDAVGQTLRHSKFELAQKLTDPIVIVGFQKVDVYEANLF